MPVSSQEHTGVSLDFQAALANEDTMKSSAGLIASLLGLIRYFLWVSRTGAQVDAHRQHRLTLAPGFIDTHSHADSDIFERPDALAAVSQGITTVVVGQDGESPFPLANFFSASFGGRYICHVRSEDRYFWEAIDGAIQIGRAGGLPVKISHMKLAMSRDHAHRSDSRRGSPSRRDRSVRCRECHRDEHGRDRRRTVDGLAAHEHRHRWGIGRKSPAWLWACSDATFASATS